MSREPSGSRVGLRAERRDREGRRRFSNSVLAVIGVLVLLAAGLGAAGALQGPKVRDAAINVQAAIERDGQRLVLEANQAIEPVDPANVRIEPATPADVTSDGGQIVIQFADPLHYATTYHVEVDVRGTSTGASSTLRHDFTTPDIDVRTLVRGDAATPDRIVRTSLAGTTDGAVEFEAPTIQEFAVSGDALVAVTLDDAKLPSVIVATPADGRSEPIAIPEARAIRDLAAAPGETIFGYVVASYGSENLLTGGGRLYIRDLADPSGVSKEVTGIGGAPLDVKNWAFVPGTTSVVVQTVDLQILVVDVVAGGEPLQVGQHSEVRGFLPGTVELVVADPTGSSTIDLTTGEIRQITLPPIDVGPGLYPGAFLMLDEEHFVEQFSRFDTSGEFTSALFLSRPDGIAELYRPPASTSRINAVCLSPNGQFLSVEVVPESGRPDGYTMNPGYTETTTYFVQIADGTSTSGAPGMSPDWCR
ncbi:hypothetical protein [Pseudoclavibacter chungangensis]|uniref:hypothetical protein n=1 Tax=Pseudoclavibacter chungangensis TaxID=587635 RepID=UPI0015C8C5AE